MRLLTAGDFDITAVAGVDQKNGLLYFVASPDDATRRYLYRTRLDGQGTPVRVTPAAARGMHEYDVSPDGQRFLVNTADEAAASAPLTLVVNWLSLLTK